MKKHGGKRKGAGRPQSPATVGIRVLGTASNRVREFAGKNNLTLVRAASELIRRGSRV